MANETLKAPMGAQKSSASRDELFCDSSWPYLALAIRANLHPERSDVGQSVI